MKRLLLAAALCAAPAAAKRPPLPTYAHALRCAALTEATAKARGDRDPEWRGLFDHALFWGLAASEVARKNRLTGARFTQDQIDQGAVARADLGAGKAEAIAELAACDREVPPLGKKK